MPMALCIRIGLLHLLRSYELLVIMFVYKNHYFSARANNSSGSFLGYSLDGNNCRAPRGQGLK